MANTAELKVVLNHLINGTLEQSLCRVCLLPLGEVCENIFTKVCTEDQEYCIAEALRSVCHMQFKDSDNFSICSDCVSMAATSYKLYLLAKRSEEILNFYVDELVMHTSTFELPDDFNSDNICFPLPLITPSIKNLDVNISGCLVKRIPLSDDNTQDNVIPLERIKIEPQTFAKITEEPQKPIKLKQEMETESEEDKVIVIVQDGAGKKPILFKLQEDGTYRMATNKTGEILKEAGIKKKNANSVKVRQKRGEMPFQSCSRCPKKYRFLAKLKEHMKEAHNVNLYVCKVCKETEENESQFEIHMRCHTNILCCDICNAVFKKRETMISHLQWHEQMKNMRTSETAHVCELCGTMLPDADRLKVHINDKHEKKFTCYYCGRMYKREQGLDQHIKKHEQFLGTNNKMSDDSESTTNSIDLEEKRSKQRVCTTCGKTFVDQRSLMWHTMLHTNERPFKCTTCGRGFISVNRRNQHALCAHTAPARRCPLCPALFHLRSMVNTHIKKVHLSHHKRRRSVCPRGGARGVWWRTEPVPLTELAVSVQARLLEMQTKHEDNTQDDGQSLFEESQGEHKGNAYSDSSSYFE